MKSWKFFICLIGIFVGLMAGHATAHDRPCIAFEGRAVTVPDFCVDRGWCDEESFDGVVPEAVLARHPKGAEAIEIHYRSGKSSDVRYKAKRGWVSPDSEEFHPEIWRETGKCVRVYWGEKSQTSQKLGEILLPGEYIERLYVKDAGGNHNTREVYVIYRK